MEPPSPIRALGVNPFQSRFIIRTFPEEISRPDSEKSQSQRRNDSAIVIHQQQEIRCSQAKHNHKLVKRDKRFHPSEIFSFPSSG